MVHFPIAFALLLFIFAFLNQKKNVYDDTIKVISALGLISTVFVVITGYSQIEPFENTSVFSLVEVHRILGFAVLFVYLIFTLSTFKLKSKTIVFVISLVLAFIVSLAGFYGGIIAH